MGFVLDRAQQTSGTQGTVDYKLDETVDVGFQTLKADAIVESGDPVGPWEIEYAAVQGAEWEIVTGTLTDNGGAVPDILSRDVIHKSTNGGSKVDWGAGTRTIFSCARGALQKGGGLVGVQVFKIPGTETWNKGPDTRRIMVQVVGAGGGGGGGNGASASFTHGGGGGAGAFAEAFFDVEQIASATVVIGGGGAGGLTGLDGAAGGSSSYSDGANSLACEGGSGGTAGSPTSQGSGGDGGAVVTPGHLNLPGEPGDRVFSSSNGGNSFFAAGGKGAVHQTSNLHPTVVADPGNGPGAGGGGGYGGNSIPSQYQEGAVGANGRVIIYEYR